MPKVQQYGGEKVTSQNVRGPRAQSVASGAFGGPIFQGLGDLAVGIGQFQERADITAAEDAMVRFEREKNKMFFDPETGYFNKQGRDAYESSSEMTAQLDALRERYSSELQSAGARQAFDKVAATHITRGRADIMQHATKGLQAWEIGTIEASVENTVENAALYYNSPEDLGTQHALGRQSVLDASKMKGMGSEETAEALQTYTSQFYKTAIATGLTKGSGVGGSLLSKYGKFLEGPDLRELEAELLKVRKAEKTAADALDTKSRAALSAGKAREIYSSSTSMKEALAEARRIEDPQVAADTEKNIISMYERDKKAEQQVQADAYNEAVAYLSQPGHTPQTMQIDQPVTYVSLSAEARDKINSGELTKTDPRAWSEINAMTLDQLRDLDVNQYNYRLSPEDNTELEKMIEDAKSGKFDYTAQTEQKQLEDLIVTLTGKESKDWDNEEILQQVNRIRNEVQQRVNAAVNERKRKLTNEEFTKIINDVGTTLIDEGTFTNTKYNLLSIPLIDEDGQPVRPQLEAELRRRGLPLTVSNMIKLYAAYKEQQ